MRPSRARGLAIVLVLLTGAWGGCDSGAQAPPATCAVIGTQCQLPGGPLGVCQQAPCDATATPPCFKCTSQH